MTSITTNAAINTTAATNTIMRVKESISCCSILKDTEKLPIFESDMPVRRNKSLLFCLTAFALLLILAAADLSCGDIPMREIIQGGMVRDILFGVRIPRVLTAMLAGGALAIAGSQMQAIFRNPLADPHIMGVSAGAGTGAAIATIVLAAVPGTMVLGSISIALAAFAGAAVASALIVAISSSVRSGNTLLLSGVMLGFIFSAVTSIIEYSANEETLKLFYSWSAGSFSGNRMVEVWILAGLSLAGLSLALTNSKGLNIILFGEEYSELSGAPVKKIRLISMVSCCLVTGAATAFCGPIGFVGIIAPHITRWLTGTSSHRKVIPASMLCGAVLALLADILSVVGGKPLPAGSTMALIGIPVILFILIKKK